VRHLVTALVALSFGHPAVADQKGEYDAALAKWQTADVRNYTFTYRWDGAVVVAPACADATIRVKVQNGVGGAPTVVRGNGRCPRGTRGAKSIGFPVPTTIDEAFREVLRYIADPPTPVRITVSYDESYGLPKSYFVEKIQISDNDEGFKITSFKVAK
jgi:hypothetical protein